MHAPLALAALTLLACAGTLRAEERFPPLTPEQMTPEQQAVAKAIAAGPRGGLAGPFNAWLRSPDLADRLQRVGEYVRFKTSLPHRLNELAILLVARAWDAQFEWYAHYQFAMKAGLSPAIADAIAQRRRPAEMSADETVVYDFCNELLTTKNVSDATYNAAAARFGAQGVIDLIGVTGYYVMVSLTLNVAEVPVPPDSTVPALPK